MRALRVALALALVAVVLAVSAPLVAQEGPGQEHVQGAPAGDLDLHEEAPAQGEHEAHGETPVQGEPHAHKGHADIEGQTVDTVGPGHLPVQVYSIQAFFQAPWRDPKSPALVGRQAAVVLVLDALLLAWLWRKRWRR